MCGIAGFVLPTRFRLSDPLRVLSDMTSALRHRGPDDEGHWFEPSLGVGFGHRRLSIIDLSKAGHQPMQSPSGRYRIVFNGEIYNHVQLRAAVEEDMSSPMTWRGHSDTESLLSAIDAWGPQRAFAQSVGMFAAAVLDCKTGTLTLVRDRMGEKPLYYGWCNGAFLFASELKALRTFPEFSPPIDSDALGLYLAYSYVPAPWSIYQGIRKLEPGSLLTLRVSDSAKPDALSRTTYWSLAEIMRSEKFSGSEEEAADEVERRLSRAIALQKVSDVPLGCFLSGGIDSSTVTALMQAQSNAPVRTFSVGFEEDAFNEAPYAAAVARHLGTDHTELMVSAADALEVIPRVPDVWDEPFSDSSQLPTMLIAALARSKVTVSLSGDGGDELFGGYPRYALSEALERVPAKRFVAALLRVVPLAVLAKIGSLVPATKISEPRLRSLERLLTSDTRLNRYGLMLAQISQPDELVRTASVSPTSLNAFEAPAASDDLSAISAFDAVTYLPDDILVKLDRAAMSVSLETRLPLLDHRVVEFAFQLPASHKRRNGKTKWPLRRILQRYVPTALTERPKQGFSVPLADWLRGPLRSWGDDLLTSEKLTHSGLEPKPVMRLWRQHQSGMPHLQNVLWAILMYQAWFARNG
jgi:asparagine synthase (glutamine-hydrolysing)